MTIRFSEEVSGNFPFDPEEVGKEVILQALESEGFPYEAEVDLTLTNDAMIHELNEQFRKIDAATDVLSFPLIEYPSAGDFSKLEEDPDAFSPESGEAMLGDIVISLEHAARQAEEYGHSLEREVGYLTVHSMMHLLGYDHVNNEEEAAVMRSHEEAVMTKLRLPREAV